jgi:hypothetical protein
MNQFILWIIRVGLLASAAGSAAAQDRAAFSWPPPVGSRTRLIWKNEEIPPVIVDEVSATPDSLKYVLTKGGGVVSIGIERLRRVDVSLERNTHVMQDAGIGFGIGALLGAAAGYSSASGPSEKRGYAILEGLAGGGFGFVVGGVLGLLHRSDKWIPVALPIPSN